MKKVISPFFVKISLCSLFILLLFVGFTKLRKPVEFRDTTTAIENKGIGTKYITNDLKADGTARTGILFSSDFETTGDLAQWETQMCCGASSGGRSSTFARAGTFSEKFILNKTDAFVAGSLRSELLIDPSNALSTTSVVERWYSVSVYLDPTSYGGSALNDPNPEVIWQLHSQNGCDCPPPFAIWIQGGRYVFYNYSYGGASSNLSQSTVVQFSQDLGAATPGVWTDFVFHLKHNSTSAGLTQVWINGTQLINRTGANIYNETQGLYLKIGIYKFSWNPSSGWTPSNSPESQRVRYTDEVRIGDQTSSYNDVAVVANTSPVANAGPDQTVQLPGTLTVDGSASTAGSGATITSFAWSKVSGGAATITSPSTASTTITGIAAGVYKFKLAVTNSASTTVNDTVQVTVVAANLPPVANAGSNQTITLPTNSVTLNGTASSDPDGTIASYQWAKSSGTGGTITSATAGTTTVTGLSQGTYVYTLTVTDNKGATNSASTTITVGAAANVSPTANAGSDQAITLPISSTVLDGSVSSDPDGTIATYAWVQVSGPNTSNIVTPAGKTTTVSGLVAGTYVYRLTVTDNKGATATDNVSVNVNPAANKPPVANAGSNQSILLPTSTATLNGTASADPDGTIAAYLWTKTSGPTTFTITSSTSATTTVTGLIAGTYVFNLRVTDNSSAIANATVTIIVTAAVVNKIPVAKVNPTTNTITLPVDSVLLNGTASLDSDGTVTAYLWAQVSGPGSATIQNAATSTTFVKNLVAGTYIFSLRVTDNSSANSPLAKDTVIVNAAPPPPDNVAPTARAGADQVITLPIDSTILNGNTSSDPDGTISTYLWTKEVGPNTPTIRNSGAALTVVAGLIAGDYRFRLTVTDNSAATASDTIHVHVNAAVITPTNQLPVANAGAAQSLTLPKNYTTLTGTKSYDPDGKIVTYLWQKQSGGTVTIKTPAASTTSITGMKSGTYKFLLTVTDNLGAKASATVTITVKKFSF